MAHGATPVTVNGGDFVPDFKPLGRLCGGGMFPDEVEGEVILPGDGFQPAIPALSVKSVVEMVPSDSGLVSSFIVPGRR